MSSLNGYSFISRFSNVSARIRIQTKFIMFNEIVLLIRENYSSGSAFPLNLCNAKNCKEIAKNNIFTVLALYKDQLFHLFMNGRQ